jgi:hypothetical protein
VDEAAGDCYPEGPVKGRSGGRERSYDELRNLVLMVLLSEEKRPGGPITIEELAKIIT